MVRSTLGNAHGPISTRGARPLAASTALMNWAVGEDSSPSTTALLIRSQPAPLPGRGMRATRASREPM